MKYLFILFILASCTISSGQDKDDERSETGEKWEYKLDMYDNQSALCQGDLYLPEELCESELEELLLYISKHEVTQCEKLRLFVRLESNTSDDFFGYWAIALFDPNMSVEYSSITPEQIRKLPDYKFPENDVDEVIGEWILDPDIITIYRKDGQLMLHYAVLFGDVLEEYELGEVGDGTYFDSIEPEDIFAIQKNGNLICYHVDDPSEFEEVESLENFIKNNPYEPCVK